MTTTSTQSTRFAITPPAGKVLPKPSPLFDRWQLDANRVYLNHGSFGGTPRAVLAEQQRFRDLLEAEPVRFFVELHDGLMDESRDVLASFLRCPADCVTMVPNATVGVATVLASHPVGVGDEILMTDHEYTACQNNLRRWAHIHGAIVVKATIPFPCPDPDTIVKAILSRVTNRTKMALISHVTSPTGIVMPVEQIVPALEQRGVRVIVDGAHAPGMLPWLDLGKLAPSFYAANCHKWICSPKGSAFLYVRPDLQRRTRPVVLSNFAEKPKPGRSQFWTEFDYIGTQDYTPWYSIKSALETMAGFVEGGWPAVAKANHDLCIQGRTIVCNALGVAAPLPEPMIGSIATIILPEHSPERTARLMARPSLYHDALQDRLLQNWGIQVPVWGPAAAGGSNHRYLRISSQLHNTPEQYTYLAEAVSQELAAERLL